MLACILHIAASVTAASGQHDGRKERAAAELDIVKAEGVVIEGAKESSAGTEPHASVSRGIADVVSGQHVLAPHALRVQRAPCSPAVWLEPGIPPVVDTIGGVHLNATLRIGRCYVLGASVNMEVDKPRNMGKVTMSLLDNGIGADYKPDDGVYSVTFSQLVGKGRYHVATNATSMGLFTTIHDPLAALQRHAGFKSFNAGGGRRQSARRSLISQPRERKLGAAAKEHLPASFIYMTQTGDTIAPHFELFSRHRVFNAYIDVVEDQVPPDPVRDLRIHNATSRVGRPAIELTWTSTGAHGTSGKAAGYELRISVFSLRFATNFSSGHLVGGAGDVLSGSLNVEDPFSQQKVTVALPTALLLELDEDEIVTEMFAAIVVKNHQGLGSEVSNLAHSEVTVALSTPVPGPVPTNAPTTKPPGPPPDKKDTEPDETGPPQGSFQLVVQVGIASLIGLATLILLLAFYYNRENSP